MMAGIASINSMVTVCIYLHIELLVELNQLLTIFNAILIMYIIIGHTMY